MIPPDSDERVVRDWTRIIKAEITGALAHFKEGTDGSHHLEWIPAGLDHDLARLGTCVSLPLPLAQRILAALEGHASNFETMGLKTAAESHRALAAELRERMGQKP